MYNRQDYLNKLKTCQYLNASSIRPYKINYCGSKFEDVLMCRCADSGLLITVF